MPRIKVCLTQRYPHKVENPTLEYIQLLKTLLALLKTTPLNISKD